MNITTLLKLATARLDANRGGVSTSKVAYAEVDASGTLVVVNPLASMKWGWQQGSQVQDEMHMALEGLAGQRPTELPLKIGGLHIGALVRERHGGWLVFGYDPDDADSMAAVDVGPLFHPRPSPDLSGSSRDELEQTKLSCLPPDESMDDDSLLLELRRHPDIRQPVATATPVQLNRGAVQQNALESSTGTNGSHRDVQTETHKFGSTTTDAASDDLDEKAIQQASNTLRLLATTSPDHVVFCDAAMQTMAKALRAERCLLFVKNGKGDLILGATSHSSGGLHRESLVLTDDHPVFQHVDARGSSTHVNRAIAPVICSQVNFTNAVITAVRDNGRLIGYVFSILDERLKGKGAPSADLLRQIDQLVTAFGSLYAWISVVSGYRDMVAAVEDVVFSFQIGPNGMRRYGFVAGQITSFSGYRPEELLASPRASVEWVDHIVHEEDRALVRSKTRDLESGKECVIDYRIVHRNGSVRWIREHAWTNTNVVGMQKIAGVLKDVSEMKAMEAMVADSRKDADASRRSKTAFTATMSHEVRTPLGALTGYAQLLQKELSDYEEKTESQLPEQIHEFVNVLTNRSYKLQSLVHDLFELSNLEMGGATTKREPVRLQGVVQNSAAKVSLRLQRKGVELLMDLCQEDMIVLSDTQCLEQVLDNVLSNATKFTETGSVTIRAFSKSAYAVIEVEDTGIGISEDYQGELFEAFSQEENWRNRRFGGAGLGLALARRLLNLLDGKIEVESEKGKGSTFRVLLPLASA